MSEPEPNEEINVATRDERKQQTTSAEDILRSLKTIGGITAVMFLLIVAGGVWIYTNSKSSTEALCALRGEVEKRVETNQQFLIDNPKGVTGIDPKTIESAIKTSKSTIRALKGLDCPA